MYQVNIYLGKQVRVYKKFNSFDDMFSEESELSNFYWCSREDVECSLYDTGAYDEHFGDTRIVIRKY